MVTPGKPGCLCTVALYPRPVPDLFVRCSARVFAGVPSALSGVGAAAVAVSEAGCFIRGPEEDPGRAVHSNAGRVKNGQSTHPAYSSLI